MAAADFKIVIGAKIQETKERIKEDLQKIADSYDKSPLQIKVGIDSQALTQSVAKAIPEIQKNLNHALSQAIPVQVNINPSVGGGKLDSAKQDLKQTLSALSEYTKSILGDQNQFTGAIDNIKTKIESLSNVKASKYITQEIREIEKSIQKFKKSKDELLEDVQEFENQWNNSVKKNNSNANTEIVKQIDDIRNRTNNLNDINGIQKLKQDFSDLNKELKNVDISKYVALKEQISAMQADALKLGIDYTKNPLFNTASKKEEQIHGADFPTLSYTQQVEAIQQLEAALKSIRGLLREESAFQILAEQAESAEANAAKLSQRIVELRQTYSSIGQDSVIDSALSQMSKELNGAFIGKDRVAAIKKELDEYEKFIKEFDKLQKENDVGGMKNMLNQSIDGLEKYIAQLGVSGQNISQKIADIRSSITSLQDIDGSKLILKNIKDLENEANRIQKAKTDLTSRLKDLNDLLGRDGDIRSGDSYKEISDSIKNLQNRVDNLNSTKAIEKLKDDIKELRKQLIDIDTSSFAELSTQLDAYTKRGQKLGIGKENAGDIGTARSLLEQINGDKFKLLNFKDQEKIADDFYNTITKIQNRIQDASALDMLRRQAESVGGAISKLTIRMEGFGDKYDKLKDFPELQARYNNILNELKSDNHYGQSDIARLTKEVNEFESSARRAGVTTKSLGEWLGEAYQKFGGWALVTNSMMKAISTIKQMVSAVRELDAAATELRKVIDMTDAAYSQFFSRAAVQAKELGTTITNYINSAADFARLGYSLGDAEQLARTTSIYFNVADGMESIDEATQSVISTMKAFNIDATDSMKIVDLFNHTSNNFAISAAGIGDAMQRSASALRESGSTLEESVALITAANSVIQDPEKVGTALKTLSLRMRGAKADLEDAGLSVDGMATSVSRLREQILALTGQKVDIMIDSETFKSPYQMLEELSKVWNAMSDINRSAALELLGGKNQANILASLINNFETAQDVMKKATSATGSAVQENERYLDSINGKIAQFKANFESLSATVVNSDLVKGGFDFGSGLVHGLDTIIQKLGGFPSLITAVASGFMAVKKVNMFDEDWRAGLEGTIGAFKRLKIAITDYDGAQRTAAAKSMFNINVEEYNNALKLFDTLKAQKPDLSEYDLQIEAINQSFQKGSLAARDYAKSHALTAESLRNFCVEQNAAIEGIHKMSLASKAASIAGSLLTNAMFSIGVAITSVVIDKLIDRFDEWIHTQERAVEAAEKLRGEFESISSEVEKLKQELDGINSRINELDGKTLTLTEEGELAKLREQKTILEETLAIQEQFAEYKKAELNDKAVDFFQATDFYKGAYGGFGYGSVINESQEYLDKLETMQTRLSEHRAELEKISQTVGTNSQAYQEELAYVQYYEQEIQNTETALGTIMPKIQDMMKDLDPATEKGRLILDVIREINSAFLELSNTEGKSFEEMISANGLDDVDKKLKDMALSGELTPEIIEGNKELSQLLLQVGMSSETAYKYYTQYAEAVKNNPVAPNVDLSSPEALKNTLADIIQKANILSAMDINPVALSSGTTAQQEAWTEIQSIMETTGMSLDELINKMVEFGLLGEDGVIKITQALIDASQNTTTFANNINQVTTRTDSLVNAYKELAKGQQLSTQTVTNLMQVYPQLETKLMEYLAGVRTHAELMADLDEVYKLDGENWKALMLAKLAYNEDFFSSIIANNEEWVTAFYKEYGVDLSNCKTYAEAKLKVMQTLNSAFDMVAGRTEIVDSTGAIINDLKETASVGQDAAIVSEQLDKALQELANISMSPLEGQFHSLGSTIDDTKSKANEAAQAIQSIASTSLSAINSLVDMTVSMLKQDLTTQKEGIETELKGLQDSHNTIKKQLEADKKSALASLDAQRKALQDQKKAQDKAYDGQIKNLQKVKSAQDEIYSEQIKAAQKELDAYNKIIEAQLKLLRLKEEQRDYERELSAKQKDVASIEAKLAELGLDDSIEAQKKRLQLEEELAAKRDELNEFQHDKNISDQEKALENEKEAFNDKQQAIIEGIQSQKDAYDKMIESQIEGIRNAKEAFDESMQAQLDALSNQKEQMQSYYDQIIANEESTYQAQKAIKDKQKEELDKQIQDEAALKKKAIELIEGRSDEFYKRLLEWNRKYGSGLDADVIIKWNNAYSALKLFGGEQQSVLDTMNRLSYAADSFSKSIEDATKKAGELSSALNGALAGKNYMLPADWGTFKATGGLAPKPSYKNVKSGKTTGYGAKFHDGGEVGKDNMHSENEFSKFMENLKSNELPAILKKKEWVLTEEQQGNLLNLTNTQKQIIGAFERMYQAVSSGINKLPSVGVDSLLNLPEMPEFAMAGGDSNAVFNFNTTITGNADDDVLDNWFNKNVSAFEDRFARYTLGQVNFKRDIRTKR